MTARGTTEGRDLAMQRVRRFALGIPRECRRAFHLLVDAGKLDARPPDGLERRLGVRNTTLHDDQRLSVAIVRSIG